MFVDEIDKEKINNFKECVFIRRREICTGHCNHFLLLNDINPNEKKLDDFIFAHK